MNAKLRDKFIMLIVFLFPYGAVQMTTIFMTAPQSAIAAPQPTPVVTILLVPPTMTITDVHRAAAKHAVYLRAEPFERSPMDYHVDVVPDQPPDIDPAYPDLIPPPNVRLQLSWASKAGNMALIDGKRYSEGDQLKGSEWIVRKIDGENRIVVLEDTKGEQTEEISIDKRTRSNPRPGPTRRRR